jgi:beta-glucosidase/6-phospho-beta-glucosidase/beta-galactosidase
LLRVCCIPSQTLERIPKMSANWYAEVVKKNRLDMM